jgi:hypothetical protein
VSEINWYWLKKKVLYLKEHIKINENGCWIWQRAKDKDGYPKVRIKSCGLKDSHQGASRILLILKYGYNKPDYQCLHICNTPSCINPDHLYFGTPKQNAIDRVNGGHQGHIPPPMWGINNPWYGKRPPMCDTRTHEERSKQALKDWEKLSAAERTQRANKIWETRRLRYGPSGISSNRRG